MELIINIEKIVINFKDTEKNSDGLIAKDVVEFVSSVINKEEKENKNLKNMGISTSSQMQSHMPYLVDVDNTVLSKCEDRVCFYDFEKEIFSNGEDYAKDVFIECFESKSKEILKHLVETPMSRGSLRVIYFECFDGKGINRKYLIECEMTSKKYIG